MYVFDWTNPEIGDVTEEIRKNIMMNLADIYICADYHDIICRSLEDLKKAIEIAIPLRKNNIIEIDISKEVTFGGKENLKYFLQNQSGYLYFYDGKLKDVPVDLMDRFGVLAWKRINGEYFEKSTE